MSLLSNTSEYSLILKNRQSNHHQYNLPTAEQVAIIILGYDADSMEYGRDINVIRRDGNLKKVQETKGYYDPLQYHILFPFGTRGWDVNTTNWRLRWIKEHQSDIRVELYQGLHDALHVGETNAENIGKRTILSSSFIGSHRDMTQRYEDGVAIILNGGLTSWEYVLRNNGMTFNTFKKPAEDRGFLETDHIIRDCLVRATSLRCHMFYGANNVVESDLTNMLLKGLNELLNLHGKKIEDYDLPSLPPNTTDGDAIPSFIQEELAVDIPNEDIEFVAKLINDQMIAFKTIMNVIVQKHNGVFFVDGPRGTCKTFLYLTLMASLRIRGEIVLATATSGIAATLLPSGRSAHSRFKIPIDIQPSFICGIQKQKDLANLIRLVVAIIWDEAPMTNKNCLEALNRPLQDICRNNASFGGKVLIMGRDFCQVFPVVRKGTKTQMISVCIVQSHLWDHTKIFRLRQNMRSLHDQEFAEFLIRIGDGV
ncbi:hypothetical protein KIW84_062746 [Lathyrus oleraceus]|uniref:ATP-dependent DNA helicase n=2 Tax=Pisum sativum TaxID=3888 RepID=A0A9D4W8B3_PEA|nr:hypothetical protein KIW84_062746 [Pisum sativum]